MTKKSFDLAVAVTVGVIASLSLVRLWATRQLIEGPSEHFAFSVAKIAKVVTA